MISRIARLFGISKNQAPQVLQLESTGISSPWVVSGQVSNPAPTLPIKRILGILLISFLLVSTGFLIRRTYEYLQGPSPSQVLTPTVKTPKVAAANTSESPAATSPTQPQAAPAATTPTPKACSPIGPISLSAVTRGVAPGLYTNVESPRFYSVHGYTTDQIRRQINSCGPLLSDGHRYAASTAYNVNWSFSQQALSDNPSMCKIVNPVFVMQIRQTLPIWQDTASAGVTSLWQRFASNLRTHENGHVDLNVATARKIYTNLQNLPAASCKVVSGQATTMIQAELASLKTQNAAYDHDTDHGTHQGTML